MLLTNTRFSDVSNQFRKHCSYPTLNHKHHNQLFSGIFGCKVGQSKNWMSGLLLSLTVFSRCAASCLTTKCKSCVLSNSGRLYRIFVRPSIDLFSSPCPYQGHGERWRLSQVLKGERQGTPWTSSQFWHKANTVVTTPFTNQLVLRNAKLQSGSKVATVRDISHSSWQVYVSELCIFTKKDISAQAVWLVEYPSIQFFI